MDTQIMILRCLGEGPKTSEQISKELNLSKKSVEYHLRNLCRRNLVFKIRFVKHRFGKGRGRVKYGVTDLFGDLANKTYYFLESQFIDIMRLMVKHIPKNLSRGQRKALTHALKYDILRPIWFGDS